MANAQSILYEYHGKNHLRLETNRPLFKNAENLGFLTSANYINGHFKIDKNLTFTFDLPISHISQSTRPSDTEVGNIGLGIQIRNKKNNNYIEVKMRVPSYNEAAIFGGSVISLDTDYTERLSAFLGDVIPVSAGYFLTNDTKEGLYFALKPCLEVWLSNSDNFNTEGMILLNVAGGYRARTYDFNAGMTSVTFFSEAGAFGERTERQIFTNFSLTNKNFQPGAVFRIPLGGTFSRLYDLSIGFSLNYIFGNASSTQE